jgi:hypothetical protein
MTKLVVEIFDDGALSGTRPATQSEIDAAASPQMREDAEVGRAIRVLPDNCSIDVNLKWYGCEVIDFRTKDTKLYKGKTAYAALIAAGLLKELRMICGT